MEIKSSFVIFKLIKGYMVEAKWFHECYIPAYDDDPNIIKVVSIIYKVLNDMSSLNSMQQCLHVAPSFECFMEQYGVSQMEAYNFICKDVEDCWKHPKIVRAGTSSQFPPKTSRISLLLGLSPNSWAAFSRPQIGLGRSPPQSPQSTPITSVHPSHLVTESTFD
ncbi:putative terpene synthase 2, partial [Mucuna pruriens]